MRRRTSRTPTGRSLLRHPLTLLAAVAMTASGPAVRSVDAATFTVDPTQISLTGRTGSVLLTLRNESQEPLRFQLSVFAWNQSPSGEMKLDPTEDIVFFPAILTLQPAETRRVRVGSVTSPESLEKTYRIFVEELPPPDPGSTGVRVLTKMGIPIFIRPAKPQATAVLQEVGQIDGRIHFTLANTGTVHFVPQSVTVEGFDGTTQTFSQEMSSWYVLAGGRREFELAVPDAACKHITSLAIVVDLGSAKLQERLQTPRGTCSS
jgi:fimbrial chaperone protein